MSKLLVCLVALTLPALLSAETFKVTIDRKAQVGTATLMPGEYKVTIDMTEGTSGRAEFRKGKESITTQVKQETLPNKASNSFIRYTNAPDNKIGEIVTRGASVRWLFP
jgi:hypothetical protein